VQETKIIEMEINITLLKVVLVCFFSGALVLIPKSKKSKILLVVSVSCLITLSIHAFDTNKYGDFSGYFSWAPLPVILLAILGAIAMGVGWLLFSHFSGKDAAPNQ
jgi:hypothetical protein